MLKRTHIAIGAFAAIFFFPHVNDKLVFVPAVLIASLFPEVDYALSFLSKTRVLGSMGKGFVKTRGLFHSFTFCFGLSILLAFYFPIAAFGFFLGYGLHLLVDSWTLIGIRPFWPLEGVVTGRIGEKGTLEESIFFVFVILDFIFLFVLII